MKNLLLILLLLSSICTYSLDYGDEAIPENISDLVDKLRNQIFQNGNYDLTSDLFSSSTTSEVSSFIDTLEKTGDPDTIRAYLSYLSQNEGTRVRYLEVLKKKLAQNPETLRKIQRTLNEIKGEMKKSNLRFPVPIRCAAGVATYIGMQDWYLSFKSSFFQEESLEDLYKELIVDPSYKVLMGFMAATCLADAILSVKNSREYFRELKIDKNVEKSRQYFLDISNDLVNSRTSLSYSKANIDALIFIDQHITELADKLAESLKIKMSKQKNKLIKGLKGLYFSYLIRSRHKDISQKFYKIFNKNIYLKEDEARLLSDLQEDFSAYFQEYRKTDKGESLREIEKLYEKEVNELVNSRQPAPMTKACYGGLGVATTLFGLHAAAGRHETEVDDVITKLVRNYYFEYNYIIVTALIAPCVWQMNHFPRVLFKRYITDTRGFILDHKDLGIVKKALLNNVAIGNDKVPIFTSPVDIVKKAINPKLNPRVLLSIPSRNCLEKLKKISRAPSAEKKKSCFSLLKSLLTQKDVYSYIDYRYDSISQLRSYNELFNVIEGKGKLSPLKINNEINARAAKYCD